MASRSSSGSAACDAGLLIGPPVGAGSGGPYPATGHFVGGRLRYAIHHAGSRMSDREKQVAAEAAAALVEDGMTVGLGTGSTVAHLLPALAGRGLSLRCVATSVQTEA